jgi:hypothetical protein
MKKFFDKKLKKITILKLIFGRFFIVFSLIVLFGFFLVTKAKSSGQNFNSNLQNYNAILEIFNKNKEIANFKVAIAKSDSQRSYGLMNLQKLPENYGMIFIFPKKQIVTMWMKNTKISLDMIFIDDNNKIIKIAKNAIPNSLEIISSEKKVVKVLEINAGISAMLNLEIGNIVKLTE